MTTQENNQVAIADITAFLNFARDDGYYHSIADLIFNYEHVLEDLDVETYTHNIAEIKIIDSYGGEGKGDEYWHVIKLTHKNGSEHLVKLDGYYASYTGISYGEWFFVKPVQVMVTQYVKSE